MPTPYDVKNPDWLTKEINDLQTAVEMNKVVADFKHNANVLQSIIQKIAPSVPLSTVSQLVIPAINELQNLLSASQKTPSWKTLTNGQVWNFPSGKRGDAWAIRISNTAETSEDEGAINPDGAVWLGGTSGIIVGHMTLLICMENSAGGSYATVGHKYLIINQKKATSVISVTTYSALPPNNEALIGVIYLVLDTGNTYYFDTDVNDYVQIGTVVEGTLITSTIFEDENNIPVIPDGTKLYLDTVTGKYYRWDGVVFMPINTSESGGSTPSLEQVLTVGNTTEKDIILSNYSGTTVEIKQPDDFGEILVYDNSGVTPIILSFTGTNFSFRDTNYSKSMSLSVYNIDNDKALVLSSSGITGFKGLDAGAYYGKYYTENTYIQKKYVDDKTKEMVFTIEEGTLKVSSAILKVISATTFAFEILEMRFSVSSAPVGSDIQVFTGKNSTGAATYTLIADGERISPPVDFLFSNNIFNIGDSLEFSIIQVGSSREGSDLQVTIIYKDII